MKRGKGPSFSKERKNKDIKNLDEGYVPLDNIGNIYMCGGIFKTVGNSYDKTNDENTLTALAVNYFWERVNHIFLATRNFLPIFISLK